MKILLDECVDRRLARELTGHDVKTVPQMGWAGTKNGELLRQAENEFEIFLTTDKNIKFQQTVSNMKIAILVLDAPSNRLSDLILLREEILSVLPTLIKGKVHVISTKK